MDLRENKIFLFLHKWRDEEGKTTQHIQIYLNIYQFYFFNSNLTCIILLKCHHFLFISTYPNMLFNCECSNACIYIDELETYLSVFAYRHLLFRRMDEIRLFCGIKGDLSRWIWGKIKYFYSCINEKMTREKQLNTYTFT